MRASGPTADMYIRSLGGAGGPGGCNPLPGRRTAGRRAASWPGRALDADIADRDVKAAREPICAPAGAWRCRPGHAQIRLNSVAACARPVPMSGWRGRCPGAAHRTVAPESLAHPGELALGRRCDIGRMTAWKDVERAEPEFAQRVRGLFDGHRHKTIATLRADGSPRISGIEVAFEDGELAFGSMPIRGSHCTAPRSTRSRARKRSGRVRRRSLGGRSMRGHSPRDPTATASTPTSPRSYTRTSTRRPRCSSLSGGPPRTGCAGSSASNLRPRAIQSRLRQTAEMLFRRRQGRAPRARRETLAMPAWTVGSVNSASRGRNIMPRQAVRRRRHDRRNRPDR